MNLAYFQRIEEGNRLRGLDKETLKEIILRDFHEKCAAHAPKKVLIAYILDKKFGKEEPNVHS